jgi:hypothetical protein
MKSQLLFRRASVAADKSEYHHLPHSNRPSLVMVTLRFSQYFWLYWIWKRQKARHATPSTAPIDSENYKIFSGLRGTIGWVLPLTSFALDKPGLLLVSDRLL